MPVSLPLLIEVLPLFSLRGRDGILECVRQGRRLGIIRLITRVCVSKRKTLPRELLIPLPKDAECYRQRGPHCHDRNENRV
jgi:hypothetical protein